MKNVEWQEFKIFLTACLTFQGLSKDQREVILLMMDGMFYRKQMEKQSYIDSAKTMRPEGQ